MEARHLSIVIPAYNEEARLQPSLVKVREYFAAQSYPWDVAIVSDGSSDRTDEIAAAFAKDDPRFTLLSYKPNRGKGFAVRKGMLAAKGDLVLFMDADLATPIEETEKLLQHMRPGTDIAIGSRPLKESNLEVHQPFLREAMGRMSNQLVQMLAVKGIHDTQCGFKMFTREACQEVFKRCALNGFSFDFEALMIARDLNLKIEEIPIRWAHQEGSKVVFWRDYPRALKDLIALRLKGKQSRLEIREP
ncbi:MAG: glycosyltransferase family 2 protein [Armatimonadetes bacterium]|nr:glycosyltransferase family 2 protein [Armatimonadota bacterium]